MQTTTVGLPDDATRALELALFQEDVAGLRGPLAAGARLDFECMVHEARDGMVISGLTAMSWAVILDAEADGLFLTPLLLHHGGSVVQVDSQGRTLLAFAWSRPVARHLLVQGVPVEGGESVRCDLLELLDGTSAVGTVDHEDRMGRLPPAMRTFIRGVLARTGLPASSGAAEEFGRSLSVPKCDWAKVLDNEALAVLRRHHYVEQPLSQTYSDKGVVFQAAFHPAEAMGWALRMRDEVRVGRLIKLGGANGDFRFTHELEFFRVAYAYRGLTATGLAVLVDCENERRGEGGSPWVHRPPASPVFTIRLAAVTGLSGVHDASGNTLLHLALSPAMAGWLLEQGAPWDVPNAAGQLPVDVVPEDVRILIEQWRVEASTPHAKRQPRKRRKHL